MTHKELLRDLKKLLNELKKKGELTLYYDLEAKVLRDMGEARHALLTSKRLGILRRA